MKLFELEIAPYDIEILISIGQSDKELQRDMRRMGYDVPIMEIGEDLLGGVRLDIDGDPFLMRIKRSDKKPDNLACIAHECLHAVSRILRRRGITLTNESEESFCYLLSWLTNKIYERL